MKKYLIREYTEFNAQRMGQDDMPMAVHVNNPELSADGYDKHQDIIRQANVRLNNILHNVMNTPGYKTADRRLADMQEFEHLKILRIVQESQINITVYISFKITEKEYFGVIKNFNTMEPAVESEAFRSQELFLNKEWIIKTKGLLIKTIQQWMSPVAGEYQALKDANVFDKNTGELKQLKVGMKFDVLRGMDNDSMIIEIGENQYVLRGMNYYYFNYWFEAVDADVEDSAGVTA